MLKKLPELASLCMALKDELLLSLKESNLIS